MGGAGPQLVGGTTMRLFSKKGRLKTGPQRLKVCVSVCDCVCACVTVCLCVHAIERGVDGESDGCYAVACVSVLPESSTRRGPSLLSP